MTSQMAMISTVLPIAFGLFSLQFPAGLVLYFLVSNLWRLGQQELIMRKITGPMRAEGPIEVKGAEKSPPGVESGAPPTTKAPGGLRKLFQLPSAASPGGEASANGDEASEPAANGSAGGATAATQKPKPKSTPSKSGAGRSSTGAGGQRSGQPSSARRRSNKKRKRR
jgi:YidC/Oxa1 family membrane protein insertase